MTHPPSDATRHPGAAEQEKGHAERLAGPGRVAGRCTALRVHGRGGSDPVRRGRPQAAGSPLHTLNCVRHLRAVNMYYFSKQLKIFDFYKTWLFFKSHLSQTSGSACCGDCTGCRRGRGVGFWCPLRFVGSAWSAAPAARLRPVPAPGAIGLRIPLCLVTASSGASCWGQGRGAGLGKGQRSVTNSGLSFEPR